mmetsp:Transcript_774/g.2508  ORF Transcript_774/g.2508 Transcript_774/m.2508 type:complete len:309 (+) Transcript_774:1507-2433(+)
MCAPGLRSPLEPSGFRLRGLLGSRVCPGIVSKRPKIFAAWRRMPELLSLESSFRMGVNCWNRLRTSPSATFVRLSIQSRSSSLTIAFSSASARFTDLMIVVSVYFSTKTSRHRNTDSRQFFLLKACRAAVKFSSAYFACSTARSMLREAASLTSWLESSSLGMMLLRIACECSSESSCVLITSSSFLSKCRRSSMSTAAARFLMIWSSLSSAIGSPCVGGSCAQTSLVAENVLGDADVKSMPLEKVVFLGVFLSEPTAVSSGVAVPWVPRFERRGAGDLPFISTAKVVFLEEVGVLTSGTRPFGELSL